MLNTKNIVIFAGAFCFIYVSSKTMIRFFKIIFILLCFPLIAMAQPVSSANLDNCFPKREVRAVWLTTIGGLDWPHSYAQSLRSIEKQKNELRQLLDKLQRANINTVLLQTRIRGTVIYPSKLEPWDGCMSGKPTVSPGYDPLAFAVEECHKRGMEIHAWVVSVPVGRASGAGYKNLKRSHPDLLVKIGDEYFMRPEKDATARYIASLCAEIAANYDVDGIHLDYIRYSENQKLTISRQQARDNISNIVERVSAAVKQLKPWVKMSCSPIGKRNDLSRYWSRGWNAEEKGCQDVERWLKEGWMDQIYPMMYFRGNQFFPFVADWKERSHGRTVVAGLGIYFLSPKEADWPFADVQRELWVCRSQGVGTAFFRNKFFMDDVKGIYSFAADEFNVYPAIVPEMTWFPHAAPSAPQDFTVKNKDGGYLLSWKASSAETAEKALCNIGTTPVQIHYNVYGSNILPVDVSDPRNIVAQRLEKSELFVPESGQFRYFSVTAIDRYGKESKPARVDDVADNAVLTEKRLLRNNGNMLELSVKPSVLDAEYVVFETATGVAYTTKPYVQTINVADIPDGMYVLRSLSRKGKTHRLGWAFIKRR